MAENQQDVVCENCGWQGARTKELMSRACPRCGKLKVVAGTRADLDEKLAKAEAKAASKAELQTENETETKAKKEAKAK